MTFELNDFGIYDNEIKKLVLATTCAFATMTAHAEPVTVSIVKQDRMLENFNASQYYVMSEAVMNDLAEKIGRARAYDVVKEAIAAAKPGTSFVDIVKGTPDTTNKMSDKEIDAALNPCVFDALPAAWQGGVRGVCCYHMPMISCCVEPVMQTELSAV